MLAITTSFIVCFLSVCFLFNGTLITKFMREIRKSEIERNYKLKTVAFFSLIFEGIKNERPKCKMSLQNFWMQGTTRRKINCSEYVSLPDLLY